MLRSLTSLAALACLSTVALPRLGHADANQLAKATVDVPGPHADEALERTVNNLKGVFELYRPVVDSGSKIVKPLHVGGTAARPVLTMSVEKCVVFVCETVDLDAEVVLKESGGKCKRNFTIYADLSHSSDRLRETYDALTVAGCYNTDSSGAGKIDVTAAAHHGAGYSSGMIQQQIFQLLQLQIKPMTKALGDALKKNQTPN